MKIPLANSKKTAEVDSCCGPYINQFEWHLMADGSAARVEHCEEHEEPHLIFMQDEIYDRHRCEIENQSGMWEKEE